MKYECIDGWCLNLQGTEKEYKPACEATRYMLKNKIYALVREDRRRRPIVTLKLEPMMGDMMNKLNWNTVYLDGSVPYDVLRGLLSMSYRIILSSLTKKLQVEIAE